VAVKESDEQSDEITLHDRLSELTQKLGLRRPDIKDKLGKGLCRLLGIDNSTTPEQATAKAIEAFDEMLAGLADPGHRLAGRISFNVPDWPDLEGLGLDERRKWLAGPPSASWSGKPEEKPSLAVGTGRDYVRVTVIRYLEDTILAHWQQFALDEPFPVEKKAPKKESTQSKKSGAVTSPETICVASPATFPPYVERADLHAKFAQARKSGAKLIAFVGLAGMGKTFLVRRLARNSDGTEALRIRVMNGVPWRADLEGALVASGMSAGQSMSALLCGPQAPEIVVLDNFDTGDQLDVLRPINAKSLIVATCRAKGMNPPSDCYWIEVGSLDNGQALELIRLRASNLSDEDVRLLVSSLGGHALSIRIASTLLSRETISVSQFCDGLRNAPATVTDRIVTDSGESLAFILDQTYMAIYERDQLAAELLICLSFSIIQPATSQNFLQIYHVANHSSRRELIHYANAIEVLVSYSIIEFDEENDVALHPLVAATLRDLAASRIVEVAFHSRAVFLYALPALDEYMSRDEYTSRQKVRIFPGLKVVLPMPPDYITYVFERYVTYLSYVGRYPDLPDVPQEYREIESELRPMAASFVKHFARTFYSHLSAGLVAAPAGFIKQVAAAMERVE